LTTENHHIEIPELTPEKEPSSIRLVLALGIAGLLSGIILVGTYVYTAPIIKANKEAAMQRAIFKVLPQCTSYNTLKLSAGRLEEKIEDKGNKKEEDKEELLIYAGFNKNQELIGFAIPGSEPGFQDIIGAILGYNATNKVIIGFEVLESKETPGLGDKIFKDADFQTNFTSLAVEPEIIPVKKGEKQNPNEVETITGATISSKAVVRLLNNTIAVWQDAIDNYIKENDLNMAQKNE
jgi:H+/Na+-translocating ferredoxin:NAD+ oxidoreductase subunit G